MNAIINDSNYSLLLDEFNKDDITGVYNKKYMEALLNNKIPNMWLCTLILLEIEGLKEMKNYYEKDAKNKIFKEISKSILETVGELGTLGLYDEDIFVIILPLMSRRAALIFAKKLKKTLQSAPIFINGERQYLAFSIGTSTFLKEENVFLTLSQWLKATENALLKAKTLEKNSVVQV